MVEYGKTGGGGVPDFYNLDELQIEWGLTTEEFDNEPWDKVQRILEARTAVNKGRAIKERMDKS